MDPRIATTFCWLTLNRYWIYAPFIFVDPSQLFHFFFISQLYFKNFLCLCVFFKYFLFLISVCMWLLLYPLRWDVYEASLVSFKISFISIFAGSSREANSKTCNYHAFLFRFFFYFLSSAYEKGSGKPQREEKKIRSRQAQAKRVHTDKESLARALELSTTNGIEFWLRRHWSSARISSINCTQRILSFFWS